MKVKTFNYCESNLTIFSSATIDIPGLGEVKINNCLSSETIKRAILEIETALRIKLGQTMEIN